MAGFRTNDGSRDATVAPRVARMYHPGAIAPNTQIGRTTEEIHMSIRHLTICLFVVALAGTAGAQCSAALTATGTVSPGSTLNLDLTGADADSLAFLFIGETAGSTTLNFGMLGSLTVGLDTPFIPLPFGFTDMAGDLSQTFSVPAMATLPDTTVTAQAVTVDFSFGMGMPSLSFCVSNPVTVTISSM